MSGDEDVVWARARDLTVAGLEWLVDDLDGRPGPLPAIIDELPAGERDLVVGQLEELRTVALEKSAEFSRTQ